MTRLIDRWLSRQAPLAYGEMNYTGAEYAPGTYDTGRDREGSPQAIVRLARNAMVQSGIVFACEAVKLAIFSEARFKYQRTTDDSIFGDPSLRLLEHPWPNGDSGDLLTRLAQDGDLGNAYIRKALPDDGGDPVMVRLRPEAVTIVSEQRTDIHGQTWKQPVGYIEDMGPGREPQMYTTDEVAHHAPIPDPAANWRGMSWLTPVLSDVRADTRLTQYKTFHLENGAMPGLVIKYSTKLSDQTVGKLRRRLKARYGGAENAGNVLVLDEGADATVAGSSLEQLQHDAVTKAGERRVCAAAGPGLLVICGFEQGNYTTAIRQLADLWARPRWRMACSALEHLLPTSAPADVPVRLWFDVSGIAALREGELQRGQSFLVNVQGISSAVAAGFTRKSAVQAAAANDVGLLEESPSAPPPGTSARQTESEKIGPGGTPIPPTGGPAGNGQIAGRPPQAGRPQQLPGVGKPNVPNALPAGFAPMPAMPNGARGTRRSEEDGPGWLPWTGHAWTEE